MLPLQDNALGLLLSRRLLGSRTKHRTVLYQQLSCFTILADIPDRLVKDTLEVALCQRRALKVLLCLDLLCDHDRLLVLDWCHLLLPQRLLCPFVVPQIELCSDKDDWYTGCVVVYLGVPLFSVST